MGGSSMPKADYDLMAIMYSAYGIHHILCNIDGNRFQPTRYPTRIIMVLTTAGVVPGLGAANEMRRYNVKSSRIGWAHTQNDAYFS